MERAVYFDLEAGEAIWTGWKGKFGFREADNLGV